MSIKKRIVCLANSSMPGGRCVAGKELINNKPAGWIRILGKVGKKGGVPWDEFMPIQLGHIIDVALDKPAPNEHQPGEHQRENWLLDTTTSPPRWKGEGCRWSAPAQLLDYPTGPLWVNERSTPGKKNDRVSSSQIDGIKNSLYFIRVAELTLAICEGKMIKGKKAKDQVIGCFYYDNIEYKLVVTDPNYQDLVSKKLNGGSRKIGECLLTVSLAGRTYKNSPCYKLIAAIIPRDKTSRI